MTEQNAERPNFDLIKPDQQLIITNNIARTSNIAVRSGIYTSLKENPILQEMNKKAVESIADILNARESQRFNESLRWWEKHIFKPAPEKLQRHYKNLGAINKGSVAASYLISQAPLAIEVILRWRAGVKQRTFFTSWLAYINGENNIRVQRAVEAVCKEQGISFNEKEYINAFNESIDQSPAKKINMPSGQSSPEDRYNIFSFITSHSDLSNEKVRERCQLFGNYLDLKSNDIDAGLAVSADALEASSDQCTIIGWAFERILADFAKDIEHAKQFSNYAVYNDIYAAQRKRNISLGLAVPLVGLSIFNPALAKPLLTVGLPVFTELLKTDRESADYFPKQLAVIKRINQAAL